jgi:hypothetical protein
LGKEYRSFSSLLRSFLYSPVTSSLLGPNTLLNTLFSDTLSLRSSPNVFHDISWRISHSTLFRVWNFHSLEYKARLFFWDLSQRVVLLSSYDCFCRKVQK